MSLRDHGAALLAAVVVIPAWVALNGAHLTQPPAWDTATGLFPAAIFLKESGFDIASLVQEEGWIRGGPNSYALSPLTWLTAGVLRATDDREGAYVVLRAAQLLITSLWAFTLVKLFEDELGRLAPLAAWVSFLFPPVLVQTGYMYSELAIGFFTTLILLLAVKGRYGWVAVAALVALPFKQSVLIPIFAVGTLLAMRRPEGWRRDLLLLALPVVALLTLIQATTPAEAGGLVRGSYSSIIYRDVYLRLELVPDVAWLFAINLLLAVGVLGLSFWRRVSTLQLALALTVMTTLGFYLAVPYVTLFWFLPRYSTQVVPILVAFPLCLLLANRGGRLLEGASALTLLVVGALCFYNREGALYPPYGGPAFSLVERDLRYRQYLDFHRTVARFAAELPDEHPKFVSREMYHYLRLPELGYVDAPLGNVRFILNEKPLAPHELLGAQHLFVILSNPYHGGGELMALIEGYRQAGRCAIDQAGIGVGPHVGRVVEIRCPG
jgi:hypothetical protein